MTGFRRKNTKMRDVIYQVLMENGIYFRSQFGDMFDSDDDIEYEIDHICNDIRNGKNITYGGIQPSVEFNEVLTKLFKQYCENNA